MHCAGCLPEGWSWWRIDKGIVHLSRYRGSAFNMACYMSIALPIGRFPAFIFFIQKSGKCDELRQLVERTSVVGKQYGLSRVQISGKILLPSQESQKTPVPQRIETPRIISAYSTLCIGKCMIIGLQCPSIASLCSVQVCTLSDFASLVFGVCSATSMISPFLSFGQWSQRRLPA